MGKINRDNYEAFLLDSIEGNLSSAELEELSFFLRDKPELQKELQEFEAIYLEPEAIYEDQSVKSTLFREKSTGLKQRDYLLIASVEDVLNPEEQEKFSKLLAAELNLLDEVNSYSKTKIPLETITYPEKEQLLKKEMKLIYWLRYAAAAAVIFALVFLNSVINQSTYEPYQMSINFSSERNQNMIEESNYSKAWEIMDHDDSEERPMSSRKSQKKALPASPNNLKEVGSKVNRGFEKMEKMPRMEQQQFAHSIVEREPNVENVKTNTLKLNRTSQTAEEEYPRIREFALQTIRTDLLKGKTFSETILDELAALTNQKVRINNRKNSLGETKEFALQIGKFSFSQKK